MVSLNKKIYPIPNTMPGIAIEDTDMKLSTLPNLPSNLAQKYAAVKANTVPNIPVNNDITKELIM